MNQGKYVFAQIVKFLPQRVFDRMVDKYGGNKNVRHFTLTADQVALLKKIAGKWNFFNRIMQHFKIKSFWGTTENTVRIQAYSAVIAYGLFAIVGTESKNNFSNQLSINLF